MTGSFPFDDFVTNLAATGTAALAVMVATFTVALLKGKHSVVDVAWGLGFVAVVATSYLASTGSGDDTRRLLVAVLTVVWGVRLALYIGARNWGKPEDPRYDELLSRSPGNRTARAFLLIYVTQGVVLWLISLPVQVASFESAGPNWATILGVAVWAVGFGFESVGDWQLARFERRRASGAERSQVMDRGLWRYTRHPNYFGDACVWWGLFLIACGHWMGLVTIVSPLLMNYLLVKKTGKKLLEKQLSRTRHGYVDYVARTSGFFPLPRKRTGERD
ncbi:MAG TPA: DUF1295 domain-containing protein [Mycobacteriales bacterium]|jgi:steroid 5-alpha reductase family enzyme|nr:DUF1295 domain-containing protein [Mycobacteriales bacterium]